MTPAQWLRAIVDPAEERGWVLVRFDVREGLILEEPFARGLVLRISGGDITPEFIAALPEARQPE